jgi:hypothetical protein
METLSCSWPAASFLIFRILSMPDEKSDALSSAQQRLLMTQHVPALRREQGTHQKAADHHEQAAKAHRTAAQQHGSNDQVNAKQQSAQAAENSKAPHEQSMQANNKSQQQK